MNERVDDEPKPCAPEQAATFVQRFFRGARVRKFLKNMRAAHRVSTPDAMALHDLLFEMKLSRFIDAFTALKLEKQQLRVISVAELCQVTAGRRVQN